jgi:hypothetical protein
MTPAAAPHTRRPLTPFKLTPTDEEILLACARYQYVTVDQCAGSRMTARAATCSAAAWHSYLIRLSITPLGGRGKGRSIFPHGTAGKTVAQSLGKRVGVTISGGNIGLDGFCQIINQRDA